jgi:hypothetical protein
MSHAVFFQLGSRIKGLSPLVLKEVAREISADTEGVGGRASN